METLADQFLELRPDQRRVVHFALCEYALHKWTRYASAQGRIQYIESVVGTQQEVDIQLPVDALDAAKKEDVKFAYYALYNLFRKYAQREVVDDWLIVNQALSSEKDSRKRQVLLASALQEAICCG